MFEGVGFANIVILGIFIIPLVLFMIGLSVLMFYTIYLKVRDSFSHAFHLRHRRAH